MDQKKHYQNLIIRSLVIQAIRDFFTGNHYLEVDTPIRCPSVIPEAQIDPVTTEGHFLQASPELCMKRLLSKGFDKIFQICKCFRKNERGSHHLPELTMLEWYAKDNTYLDLMNQCKGLIQFIASRLSLGNKIRYQDKRIQLAAPWEKLTVEQAFDMYADKSLNTALEDNSFDEIMSFQIEPCLGNATPVFLYDYPARLASLAKLKPDNPACAQRFEFYMAGIELANGFTELTDPVEQQLRFEKENQIRISQNKAKIPVPEKFLKDLETMPDAAGIAMGVDRLVMIFCNAPSIDHIVTFTPESL
ncbi:PoxA: putative lysyl-tRNA synthetase (lysine--tRNA ligase) [Desulfobacula toluolica Tol2]|uniref:PoxA: putative lysyl-tRNA synthetase (Lysine--tRNA ligase) n=1 Tax=Desulfobacula toluolica (strain DSM 7467 / Tol2) TaxID=651182 RepID=K0NCZ8_DESTT|nr:PoxA: putative lysyl-tRNA synthetase (lysine--tRNA ligase) [Desulfobacula toluolica Tol2]